MPLHKDRRRWRVKKNEISYAVRGWKNNLNVFVEKIKNLFRFRILVKKVIYRNILLREKNFIEEDEKCSHYFDKLNITP